MISPAGTAEGCSGGRRGLFAAVPVRQAQGRLCGTELWKGGVLPPPSSGLMILLGLCMGWPTCLFHHDGSTAAWLIAIEKEGQRHHQDGRKAKHVVDIDIGERLGLGQKMLI